jgi:primosomal protein N'
VKLADVSIDRLTWKLDKPLTYAVEESEAFAGLRVGSIIRAPLRGRNARGWVVGLRDGDPPPNVQPLSGISGRGPVFDELLLTAAKVLASSYIKPLSALLRLFTPARVGRRSPGEVSTWESRGASSVELWRPAPAEDPTPRYVKFIAEARSKGLGAIVCVPEVAVGSSILAALAEEFPDSVPVHSTLDPKERSEALWGLVFGEHRVALGGRAAVMAPAFPVGAIIIHDEHDRSLKDQRSPYLDAVDAGIVRGMQTGAHVLVTSKTPRLQTREFFIERGGISEPQRSEERALWPRVEIAEPPRTGIPRRAIAVILENFRKGRRTLILLPRLKDTKAGWGLESLVSFLGRAAPGAKVSMIHAGVVDSERLGEALSADIVVGTETALTEVRRPDFTAAVALGIDSYLARTSGAGVERAFGELWALGSILARSGERRTFIVETRSPEHHLVQALTRGDYSFFAEREREHRREADWPPFSELARVTALRSSFQAILPLLDGLSGVRVLGPVGEGDRLEALLKMTQGGSTKEEIRGLMQNAPSDVRVEVKPRDW